MFLALNSLFGLPAHALVVHVAVILVPLAAVGVATTGWKASWRKSYLLPLTLLAIGGALAAIFAAQSGGPLEHAVRTAADAAGAGRPRFGEHPGQGDRAEFLAIVLAASLAVFWMVDRWAHRSPVTLPKWTSSALYVVVLIPAAAATLTMVAAGHSGATLVWKDVGSYAAGK